MRWWRVFLDKVTGKAQHDPVFGPRRRAHPRYPYRIRVMLRCSSWPAYFPAQTIEVGAGGLYLETREPTQVSDSAEVRFPGGPTLTGKVVSVLGAEQASATGKPPGLGIRWDELSAEARAGYDAIVEAARTAAPVPASDPAPAAAPAPAAPPPRVRTARVRSTVVVGIDLGTCYTSVAALHDGKVAVLTRPNEARSWPSVVAFPARGRMIIGAEARERLATDPAHTVHSPKRLLGRPFDHKEIQPFLGQAAYRTLAAADRSVLVEIWDEPYAITQLCAYLLEDARDLAERVLGERVERAVLTAPVSFDDDRMRALTRAAQLAHLDIAEILDEPSAAALANRSDPGFRGRVGVYDFGGGTFDFSIVDVTAADYQVLGTAGDSWLGGDDFDLAIAEMIANQVFQMHKVDVRKQQVEWTRLVFACERAKRELTSAESAVIVVPELLRTARGTLDLRFKLDGPTLARVCAPVIERSLTTCEEALGLLEMVSRDLAAIYLSGGATYMRPVRAALEQRFGVPIRTAVPPEHAVVIGAGIRAAEIQLGSAAAR